MDINNIPNLPGNKLRAVELLAAGQPKTRVAEAISVDNSTPPSAEVLSDCVFLDLSFIFCWTATVSGRRYALSFVPEHASKINKFMVCSYVKVWLCMYSIF